MCPSPHDSSRIHARFVSLPKHNARLMRRSWLERKVYEQAYDNRNMAFPQTKEMG